MKLLASSTPDAKKGGKKKQQAELGPPKTPEAGLWGYQLPILLRTIASSRAALVRSVGLKLLWDECAARSCDPGSLMFLQT